MSRICYGSRTTVEAWKFARRIDCDMNRTSPTPAQLARYRSEGAEFIPSVRYAPAAGHARLVEADLLDTNGSRVRHDSGKLAAAILRLTRRGRPA